MGLLAGCQTPNFLDTKEAEVGAPSKADSGENSTDAQQVGELPPFTTMVDDENAPDQKSQIDTLNEQLAALPPVEAETIILKKPLNVEALEGTRIAILLPLNTPGTTKRGRELQRLGKALLDSAQMALFDWRNPSINLIPIDTHGTPQGAATAAREAVAKGADIILGPLLSTSVQAVSPIAYQAGIPIVSFSNREEVAGNSTYIMGFVPQQQVDALVLHSIENNITKFAIMAPEGPYGEAVVKALQLSTQHFGGDINRVQFYDPQATDYGEDVKIISDYARRRHALLSRVEELEARNDEVSKAALTQLNQRETLGEVDFEAILLPTQNERTLRTIATQLAYYDVDQPNIRILGLQLWDSFGNLSSEPPLIGGWYAAPPVEGRQNFFKRHQRIYGNAPDRLASLAYDSMALAIILAGKEGTPDYSDTALTNAIGFAGVEGIFRLGKNGIAERGLAIREIQKEGIKTIKPAPSAFN